MVAAIASLTLAACGSSGADPGAAAARERSALPLRAMRGADARVIATAAAGTFLGMRAEGASPGLYFGLWDPRRGVFVRAYGSARRGRGRASVADAVRIGSISKSFTATVVLQLVAERSVALGGTVGAYAPDLAARFLRLKAS